jgi:hypothetical protein
MDPLMVTGSIREKLDPLLFDLQPAAHSQLLSDKGFQPGQTLNYEHDQNPFHRPAVALSIIVLLIPKEAPLAVGYLWE